MVVKKNGVTVIKNITKKFQGMIDGLNVGINLCKDEEKTNKASIKVLENKNTVIEGKKEEAIAFRDNLQSMLKPQDNKTAAKK